MLIVPVTPEKEKLNVGRDPDNVGLSPVMSRGVPKVTAREVQSLEIVAPAAFLTVSATEDAEPPPDKETSLSCVHSVMPELVEQAYRGANSDG